MNRHRLCPQLWQLGETAPATARRTFVLAPFGGGSAYAVAEWAGQLVHPGEAAVAIQYPGRGPRQLEPNATELRTLAADCAAAVRAHCPSPLVLVGHSLGGVLGYELAIALEDLGADVELLVASAARPPDDQRLDTDAVLAMSRDDWLTEVASGGHVDVSGPGLADVADLMIPVLRADYLLLARYVPAGRRPVRSGLLALGGADDPWVRQAHLDAWGGWTTGSFAFRVVAGGHFYYRGRLETFGGAIRERLAPAVAPAGTEVLP
ncbi:MULTISPECIES: thioesterase II family protein [unclassified Amycolatopsis]|uniref:thioesterase II family protein n=1 Tax=unclassified Amycolatopsis TaxID=2618356 RepID=UPI001C6A1985|nr:alpha/beta fold hydrolase [Amycolatopsis sp. DSM 110486]QYN21265.1 alpha/beta fold hydrolase [Amycolatopsis sp. DSM 110486]